MAPHHRETCTPGLTAGPGAGSSAAFGFHLFVDLTGCRQRRARSQRPRRRRRSRRRFFRGASKTRSARSSSRKTCWKPSSACPPISSSATASPPPSLFSTRTIRSIGHSVGLLVLRTFTDEILHAPITYYAAELYHKYDPKDSDGILSRDGEEPGAQRKI